MCLAAWLKADVSSNDIVAAVAFSSREDSCHMLDADDLLDICEHSLHGRAGLCIEVIEHVGGTHSDHSGVQQFVEFLSATSSASIVFVCQRSLDLSD